MESVLAAVGQGDVTAYVILYLAVAASWIGIPVVGATVLATAGVLASEGELNIWIVIAVATVAAWTGGYAGYVLGRRAGQAVATREGRWHRQRRRAIVTGARVYERWGRLAVFVTPTFVSGALMMPRRTFLVWNGFASVASSVVAALSAYGIGQAILGEVRERTNRVTITVAILTLAAIVVLVLAWRARSRDDRP